MKKNHFAQLLNPIRLPESDVTLGSLKTQYITKEVSGSLLLTITLPIPHQHFSAALHENIVELLQQNDIKNIHIDIQSNIGTHRTGNHVQTLEGVKNIVVIASGKGGVGKSTVSANLAMSLHKMGAKVALLDADLYGPSQPTMFAAEGEKPEQENGQFIPIQRFGIQLMSIGFMVDAKQAVVWRGPLVVQALKQMLFQTAWDNIDYLLIDLPPGTGDIQLTLAQKLPITGAVVVTTPQDIALIDAQKAINMFNKVSIPTMGIIENMSIHICSRCGHQEAIFGSEGGKKLAAEHHVPLLAQLPLSLAIRQAMDSGSLNTLQENNDIAKLYQIAAHNIALAIAQMGKDFSHIFPKIVVE